MKLRKSHEQFNLTGAITILKLEALEHSVGDAQKDWIRCVCFVSRLTLVQDTLSPDSKFSDDIRYKEKRTLKVHENQACST